MSTLRNWALEIVEVMVHLQLIESIEDTDFQENGDYLYFFTEHDAFGFTLFYECPGVLQVSLFVDEEGTPLAWLPQIEKAAKREKILRELHYTPTQKVYELSEPISFTKKIDFNLKEEIYRLCFLLK